ncbi:unnamed protein product [Discosporangium mesarthrocarpum]
MPTSVFEIEESPALRVVITGAAGQIAYSLLPLLGRGFVFGPDTRVHLRLLDIASSAEALRGVAMELQDSLLSNVEGVFATTDELEAFDGAQVAILLGGFPRKPGMERGDLIEMNVAIMQRMGEALEHRASRECKVLVVANPAPTNCLVAAANAPSIPARNFTCLSRLDEDRLVGMLLQRANAVLALQGEGGEWGVRLGPSDVRGCCVWGNHSNSQVPDISLTELRVGGEWVPVTEVISDKSWLENDLIEQVRTTAYGGGATRFGGAVVRNRGAAIMAARNLSSALSAANAIAGHLKDWLGEGKWAEDGGESAAAGAGAHKVVSMGVISDGNPHGVLDGLMCSFPVKCSRNGDWEFDTAGGLRVAENLAAWVVEGLEISVKELKEEKDVATALLEDIVDSSGPHLLPLPPIVGANL